MEFLLSLSAKSKEKLASAGTQNKSVLYSDFVLNDDDGKWVARMKLEITEYIKNSNLDGPYFLRMIDTILARDKNWVRWKVESCPSIELPPISAQRFSEAKESARRAFSNKRLRAVPMGALPLGFLDEGDDDAALDKFKARDRYALPDLESFKGPIAKEDLEIEMPDSAQSKADAVERKSSKTWRVLRVAGRLKLAAFDKIEDDSKVDSIFHDDSRPAAGTADNLPGDVRPVVLAGLQGVGKTSLAVMLMTRNPDVFGEVLQHTTKVHQSQAGYHFVDSKTFNIMLDGDRFLEFSEVDGHMYGTTRSLIDAISESGKVPLLQMSLDSVKQTREMGYDARFVLIKPPSAGALESRLQSSGAGPEELRRNIGEVYNPTEDGFDKVIVNDDLEAACKELEVFIYGTEDESGATNGTHGRDAVDIVMADAAKQ